ncbi:MAG: esterase [Nostocales cyanobacterium]|nr:MAG: esterase [Nostocales cyanobacterium]
MSKKILDNQAVPFFARFLVEEDPQEQPAEPQPLPFPPIWTWKWPSDWEDM